MSKKDPVHTRRRFAKDYKFHLRVAEDDEIFNKTIRTHGLESEWKEYLLFIERHPDFRDYQTKVREQLVADIKAVPRYAALSSSDYMVAGGADPYPACKNYMQPQYVGKTLIAIDLVKANYQSLRWVNPELVLGTSNYQELVSRYTDEPSLIQSKAFRQVIFGTLNPKFQQTVQRRLIFTIIDYLVKSKHTCFTKDALVYRTSDECVFIMEKTNAPAPFAEALRKELTENLKLQLHVEQFVLAQIPDHSSWYVKTQLARDGNICPDKLLGIPGKLYQQAYSYWFNLSQEPKDLWFTDEGRCACYLNPEFPTEYVNRLLQIFGNPIYLTHFTPQQIGKMCQLHPIWADQQSDELWISLYKEYWKVDMPTFYRKNPRKSFLNNIPPPRNSPTIAAGDYYSIGILEDGTVKAWGYNTYGKTDIPDTNGKKFAGIAAGGYHSLGILDDGTVKAWGYNDEGQTDVPNTGDKKFVGISTGSFHSLAILDDGTIKAWGWNAYGQTDIPDTNGRRFVGIAAGFRHSLALLDDGTLLAWGDNNCGQTDVPPTDGRRFVGIAAGFRHSLGLLEDGTCIGWGANGDGQTDVPPTDGKQFVAIAAGFRHSLAILEDGTVKAWGYNGDGQTDVPDTNGRRFVGIAAGVCHSLALLDDGTAIGWGYNRYGQTDVPDTFSCNRKSSGHQ